MNANELKNYLIRVYKMETLLYQQNALINSVQNKVYQLKNWTEEKENEKMSFWSYFSFDGFYFPIGAGIGALVGIVKDVKNLFRGYLTMQFFVLMLCFGAICFLVELLIKYILWENQDSERKQRNLTIAESNASTKQRNQKQINILMQEMNILQRSRDETARILRLYYNKNIIYSKYRNLIAVSSFCEYFESGRCNTLEGHEGAYNIFENEIRQNLIIQKLDDVIEHLERIENNQYMLYSAIQESNKNTKRLSQELSRTSQSLRQIESNTAITAYNSQIAAKNTEFLKWIEFMR